MVLLGLYENIYSGSMFCSLPETYIIRQHSVLGVFLQNFTCTNFSTAANKICNALCMYRKFICNFHYTIGFIIIIIIIIIITPAYFVTRDRIYCWSYNRQMH